MEPLFSEEEPSTSDKSMTDAPLVVQQPSIAPDVASLIAEVNDSDSTNVDQLRKNQSKVSNF
jgi:multidrug resistance efflux pump